MNASCIDLRDEVFGHGMTLTRIIYQLHNENRYCIKKYGRIEGIYFPKIITYCAKQDFFLP